MESKNKPGPKGLVQAAVIKNQPIRTQFWKLLLKLDAEGSRFFLNALPGQFAEFDLTNTPLPPMDLIPENLREHAGRTILLRRPFSFSDIFINYSSEGTYVSLEVIYCVLGPATVRMTSLRPGDVISVLGPLGNGFWYPENIKYALLVTGGMGAPPILHLASFLKKHYPSIESTAFVGARSIDMLPFEIKIGNKTGIMLEEFERLAIPAYVSTDDGSAGRKGVVTESLKEWLQTQKPAPEQTVIYACGPEPMLAACAELAQKHRISCQVSMERMMACGIGLCQSCAVRIQSDSPAPLYRLCCKEGPVFDSRTVLFGEGR